MARFRLLTGPVPLHHQVYLDLRTSLDEGVWAPGDRLPPERELATRYGCSLITIRRALGDLSRERRIERWRGRGTFVCRRPIDLDLEGTLSLGEELERLGHDATTRVITAETTAAVVTVAEALTIPLGASVIHLERMRMADGEPLLLEQVFLPAARFPGLLASDLEHRSLYRILDERYETPVARTREALEPVLLPLREAQLLGVEPHRPALLIEGVTFDPAGRPIEFARTFVRGDRTRYYVERLVVRSGSLAGPAASGAAGTGAGLASRIG